MTTAKAVYRGLAYATEGVLELMGYKMKKCAAKTRRVFKALVVAMMESQQRRANEMLKMSGYKLPQE